MKPRKIPITVVFGSDSPAADAWLCQASRRQRPLWVSCSSAGAASDLPWLDLTHPLDVLSAQLIHWISLGAPDSLWLFWPKEQPVQLLWLLLGQDALAARCRLRKTLWLASDVDAVAALRAAPDTVREQLAQCDLLVLQTASRKQVTQARRLIASMQPDIEAASAQDARELSAALDSINLLQPLRLLLILGLCVLSVLALPHFSFSIPKAFSLYLGTLLQALPFLMLGILLSSAIQVFVPAGFLQRIFPKNRLGGMLFALLGGFFLPVCDCASVPVFRSLVRKGVPLPAAVTFMLAAPVINPVVMLSTFYAFGGNVRIMLARLSLGVICSLLIGLLFARQKNAVLLDRPSSVSACGCGHDHSAHSHTAPPDVAPCGSSLCAAQAPEPHAHDEPSHAAIHQHGCACPAHGDASSEPDELCGCGCSHAHFHPAESSPKASAASLASFVRRAGRGTVALLDHFTEEFFEVVKFLLIGVAVSTVLQLAMGNQLSSARVDNLAEGMLLMMAMAFLLSLCSSSDAVVGKNMGSALPLGAVMGFLVFGPMMDIKNLILMSSSFTRPFMLKLLAATAIICFGVVYLAFSLGLGVWLA